uniref:Uncharacterized LOC100184590 n=1 Tax=Ciona intestinalis TaxID=7719 RepID=H2Y2W8_CIOIN
MAAQVVAIMKVLLLVLFVELTGCTDPKVYWSMDKTLGNQITPDIGNVAVFTFNTGGSFVNGYNGNALRLYQTSDTFNGVGAVADECVFEPANQCNGGLTVAAWMRPHAWAADTIVITTGKPPLLVPGFTIYPRTSIFQREIIADVISSSGTRFTATIDRDLIPLDTWTHLTMVWHETTGIKMYINGIEATYISSPASSSVSLSTSLNELKFTFGSSLQQLDFDEVKLWYNPLTPTQVMRECIDSNENTFANHDDDNNNNNTSYYNNKGLVFQRTCMGQTFPGSGSSLVVIRLVVDCCSCMLLLLWIEMLLCW